MTAPAQVDETHHQWFLKELDKSAKAVWMVAHWLNSRGHNVTVNAAGRAPTHADWVDYADNGDLNISLRVEVKALTADFTSAEDWPFRGKFIVCAKHAFDRAVPKPYGYIYLNKAKTNMAMVMCQTSKKWYVEKRTDKRTNIEQEFYLCPLDEVYFHEVER